MNDQTLRNVLDTMPAGPWHARGNKILAGTATVGYVVSRNAAYTAHQLARLPDLLERLGDAQEETATSVGQLESKLEELEEERDNLKLDLQSARDEIADLREELRLANEALDDRLAGK